MNPRPPDEASTGHSPTGPTEPSAGGFPDLPAELLRHPDYDFVEELGRGGMGAVYKAWNRRMGRVEALKVMRFGFAQGQQLRKRCLNEARLVGKLNHPNIITAYHAFEAGGALVLAMEY